MAPMGSSLGLSSQQPMYGSNAAVLTLDGSPPSTTFHDISVSHYGECLIGGIASQLEGLQPSSLCSEVLAIARSTDGPDGYQRIRELSRVLFDRRRMADRKCPEQVDWIWKAEQFDGHLAGKSFQFQSLVQQHGTWRDKLLYLQVQLLRELLCDEKLHCQEGSNERRIIEENLNFVLDGGLHAIFHRVAEDEAWKRICEDTFAVRMTLIAGPGAFREIWEKASRQSEEDLNLGWNRLTMSYPKFKERYDLLTKLVAKYGSFEDEHLYKEIDAALRLLCYHGLYATEHRSLLVTIQESTETMMAAALHVSADRLISHAEPKLAELLGECQKHK